MCSVALGLPQTWAASHIRSLLGFFMTVHHRFFLERACMYLKSKSFHLDEWMESIKNGRYRDILMVLKNHLKISLGMPKIVMWLS